VVFDNCNLGWLETAYELADSADYMVAPPDEEPAAGINYTGPLNYLVEYPQTSPEEFSIKLVEFFLEEYADDDGASYIVHAATNLTTLISQLVPALDDLATALIPLTYEFHDEIDSARKKSDTYARLREVARDIYDFADKILQEPKLNDAHAAAQRVLDTFPDVILKHGFGDSHSNSYGLAIYLPSSSYYNTYHDPDKIRFCEHNWDEFVRLFINPFSIVHNPLPDTEEVNEPITITTKIEGEFDENSPFIHYTTDSSSATPSFTSMQLEPNGTKFKAMLPGFDNGTTIDYYLSVTGTSGMVLYHPFLANPTKPATLHSFKVAVDSQPPSISHAPLTDTPDAKSPYLIEAFITDNLGVDTSKVFVNYYISSVGGESDISLIAMEKDGSIPDYFTASIPPQAFDTKIYYAIEAQDLAKSSNLAREPASGFHSYTILRPPGPLLVHGGTGYGSLLSDIEAQGYITEGHQGEITADDLDDVHVLLVLDPTDSFGSDELDVIVGFLSGGGEMFVLGVTRPDICQELTSSAGILWKELDDTVDSVSSSSIELAEHTITDDIDGITLRSVEVVLTTQDEASWIARYAGTDPEGEPHDEGDSKGKFVAVGSVGIGKVAAVVGGILEDRYIGRQDNSLLGVNTVDWLAYNTPPIACAGDITSLALDEVSVLDGSCSQDLDGVITSFKWNFGDGDNSTEKITEHTYKKRGNHLLTLEVQDGEGGIDKDMVLVEVSSRPIAYASASPAYVETNDVITFRSSSIDPDGIIVNVSWDFGDGSTSNKNETTHAYKDNGNGSFMVRLDITDDSGLNATKVIKVIVNNRPPDADIINGIHHVNGKRVILDSNDTIYVNEDDEVTFDGSRTLDIDSPYDTLNFTWDFGDNSSYENLSGGGEPWLGYGRNPTHSYIDVGTYAVVLTVTDEDGDVGVAQGIHIDVTNVAPVAQAEWKTSGNLQVRFSGETSLDTESDLDDLEYYWDFGDGERASGKIVKHTYSSPGKYTVTLWVTDDDGAEDEITFQARATRDWFFYISIISAIIVIIIIILALYMLRKGGKEKTDPMDESSKDETPPPSKTAVPKPVKKLDNKNSANINGPLELKKKPLSKEPESNDDWP